MQQIRGYGVSGKAYAMGTILGDILVSLGISKAVKIGGEAVKDVAGFVYEGSGLKYSHALYEAREAWYGVKEELPLWLTSPREAWHLTDTARSIDSGIGDLKRALFGVKYDVMGGEAIIGLPTLEAVPKSAAEEALVKGTLGMTREDIGWLPRLIAAEDIMGFAEAPRTAAFGLTVPRLAVTGRVAARGATTLAEALAETAWIPTGAVEKWGARAGFREFGTEEWLVKPPEDLGERMIKGGRYFGIDVTDITGFSKLPRGYRPAVAGKYFFEKEVGKKWRGLGELLKGTKAEVRLGEMAVSPAAIFEPLLPKLALVPEIAGKLAPEQAFGLAAAIGVKLMPKAPTRAKAEPLGKTLSSEILEPAVKVKAAQRVKMKELSALVETPVERVDLGLVPPSKSILLLPSAPPRKREETLKAFKKREAKQKALAAGLRRRIFPILPSRKIPAFLRMGLKKPKAAKNISSSSYIFSKGKVKQIGHIGKRKAKK
jgi:hypothetical protein